MDAHASSVGFYNATYGSQTVTTSGNTVTLKDGVEYTISSSYDEDYIINSWSTTAGGTLGDATLPATTYT